MEKIIPAIEWKEMSSREILNSVEIAIRVLRERKLNDDEKKYVIELVKDFIDIVSEQ